MKVFTATPLAISLLQRCRGVRWNRSNIQPEVRRRANNPEEPIQISRFIEIAISVELISLANVFLRTRSSQHSDGNETQPRVGFNLPQDVARVRFRKVEIEKDKAG